MESGAPMETVPPQGPDPNPKEVLSVIESLKKQVAADRCAYIKKKMEENSRRLVDITNNLCKLSKERRNDGNSDANNTVDLLTKRQKDAILMHNSIDSSGDKDSDSSQEDIHGSTAVLLGSSIPVRNAVRPIKLPEVKRLPPYTTWIFLDRNQRMTEDQSVVGRRRIYYDQNGGEALICSDSEEELIDEDDEKRDFVEPEDYILRMTIKEVGSSDTALELLAQCLGRSVKEIKGRYETLMKEANAVKKVGNGDAADVLLDKDLDAALDSFDNLFCRRCLAEKQLPWSPSNEESVVCSPNCYKLVMKAEKTSTVSSHMNGEIGDKSAHLSNCTRRKKASKKKSSRLSGAKRLKPCQSESASSSAKAASESSDSEIGPRENADSVQHSSPAKSKPAGKSGSSRRTSKRVAERFLACKQKRQKKIAASDSDSIVSGGPHSSDTKLKSSSRKESEDASSGSYKNSQNSGQSQQESPAQEGQKLECQVPDGCPSKEMITDLPTACNYDAFRIQELVDENICRQESNDDKSWRALEKSLFDKGVEIFGRNSCLIARNLLSGMKTCWEIFQYMNCSENNLSFQAGEGGTLVEGYSKGTSEVRRRSRFLRRRGRVRRLKYTWKSAAYHSIRKRISERKDQPCRQYNPCNCQHPCGKQCPCLQNGTCCEKYCGCPKSCKNRFRGCHCAKSQCRSRQCPCFAADRECDPDVCRNCWVSCGDGSLGVPSQRGDNYECRNMKLLLKQQQRVLLGRSDVSGWGAFLKNSVGKHEYLGEYTGELISHREADKRGKIYDRENSSFLFNLNDQFVLDAYRKGDKLKFANHSPDPNCYAKVIMVAGDHRVGIFAKERIMAGEELFYDYRYEPDRAPAWARRPEASGSRKDDGAPSGGRAKKHT